MQSAVCPRCAEPVRIPETDPAATVRCPWCRETFELREALRKLPPLLEVISPDLGESAAGWGELRSAEDEPSLESAEFMTPLVPFGEENYRLVVGHEAPRGSQTGGGVGSRESSGGPVVGTPPFPDTSIRRGRARRARGGSPIVAFAKVVAGGVAGILIALAILQYWRKLPDLGFWPFRGPDTKIFAVAAERPDRADRAEPSDRAGRSDRAGQAEQSDRTEGSDRPDLSAARERGTDSPAPRGATLPPTTERPRLVSESTEPVDTSSSGVAESSLEAATSEISAVELPLPDFTAAPEGEASSLGLAVGDAQAALARYNERQHDDSVTGEARLQPLLASLQTLAAQVATRSDAWETEREQIDDLVDSMAQDRRLLKALLKATDPQAEGSAAENDRRAAAGSGAVAIGQLSVDGSEYHLKQSASDPNPLKMLVDGSSVEVPAPGAILLVLGMLEESSSGPAIRASYLRSLTP